MVNRRVLGLFLTAGLLLAGACDRKDGANNSGGKQTLVIDGSDTMVNLAQAWAEAYHKVRPEVEIQISGGGSGVGINSLISGKVDMANSSRKMDKKEIDKFKETHPGKEPKEHIVGLDALAIYVHPSNPLNVIAIEDLAEIYGDGGTITKWSQLGIAHAACRTDEITRVSRQNNSGTYHYFRETVLGKQRDFKNGSIDQSGSKDVVELIASTPCGIGYSGMGYKTNGVKWLEVTKKKGSPGASPSVESAKNGTYPIARPLFIYTAGEPQGAAKEFLDWCKGKDGQKIVKEIGYIPLDEK